MNFPVGFITTTIASSSYVVPTKEFGWFLSVLAGIVVCKIVYEVTGVVSLLLFKGYAKLDSAQKLEWNNRGFSTFHAFFVAVASVYILLVSDIFKEGPEDGPIIFRTSNLSETALGLSLGYFVSDLAMILWTYPALGGMEYNKLITVKPATKVLKAMQLMTDNWIRHIPVVDDKGMIGIVSIADVVRAVMTQHNVGALVVVKPGEQNAVAGIITERDYLRNIIVQGRSSKSTKIGDIMTEEVFVVPNCSVKI